MMRTRILATILGLLIVSLVPAYWLGVFGRYEQIGTVNMKSFVLECATAEDATRAADEINQLDWNEAVRNHLRARGEWQLAQTIDCGVTAIAGRGRVMVNASFVPWQKRQFSVGRFVTSWDEDAECMRRNALV